MSVLARKNLLGLSLNGLQQALPALFDFYPQTWMLPAERADLRAAEAPAAFIVKPEASC